MKNLIILAAFIGACRAVPLRIVNGTDAQEGEFKYVVSVRSNLAHVCGGTILNDRFVLTAAHCVCDDSTPKDPTPYSIQYGSVHISQDTQRSVNIEAIKCESFNSVSLTYDVAVLQLATALPDGDNWEPVVLSQSFDSVDVHYGVVVGWGQLSQDGPTSTTLQKLDVRTLPNAFCGVLYDNDHHVCLTAPSGGICQGDFGGSLVVDGAQVGVASFITNRCGTADIVTPNIYARVPTYYNWIVENSSV
ncbi:chymotrypsin-1-like [Rhynchophorus ferrugineus]|uniref:chymotrypsin-1-like n=1 Tax=Rhynchophorus ferrugineus TaxID=354439 RepID=UPI003FCDB518